MLLANSHRAHCSVRFPPVHRIGSRIGSVAGARAFCFSESYTDSGIFGVYAIAAQEDAAQVGHVVRGCAGPAFVLMLCPLPLPVQVVSAAADGIKEALGGKISDEEVARAKFVWAAATAERR